MNSTAGVKAASDNFKEIKELSENIRKAFKDDQ
jgi:hypothetical protein